MQKKSKPIAIDWKTRTSREGAVADIYDRWASDYDQETREAMGYRVPERAVDVLRSLVEPGTAVLDAGAGTGLVGELLHQHGFRDLTAIDISTEMLNEARSKEVYRALSQQTLGEALTIPSASFGAVIAVGLFGPTHAPAHAFDELLRVTAPGGYIVFSMRVEECTSEDDFGRKLEALERDRRWERVTETEEFEGFTKPTIDLRFRVWGYQVT